MKNFAEIPILRDHKAHEPPIGRFVVDGDGKFIVELFAGSELTMQQFFNVFGNCGGQMIEAIDIDSQKRIKRFHIREFSVSPLPALSPHDAERTSS